MKSALLKTGTLLLIISLCLVNAKAIANGYSDHIEKYKINNATFLLLNKYSARYLDGMKIKNVPSSSNKETAKHSNIYKTHTHLINKISRHSAKYFAGMKIKSIHFGFNKADVTDIDFTNLEKVAKIMIDNKLSVKLDGFADSTGGYVYNWKLSKKRADAVKAFLVSKGVDSSRIASTEFGYTHPIATNKTSEGRRMNRRVEIKFVA